VPLKVYKRGGTYHYAGTIAGRRLRGTTGTSDKIRAEEIASKAEAAEWKRRHHGPSAVLTFAKASILYRSAGKLSTKRQIKYLEKIEDYWKDALVKDITAGAIRQSSIVIYPDAGPATRNRQVITPTRAVINHCAELEMCPPIRVRKFKFEQKIKKPVLLDWLDTFCAHARPVTAALATFMFATACRISEARRIEWDDIDFHARTILVRKTKNKKERMPNMPQRLLVAMANLPRDRKPFGYGETTLRRWWDEDIEKAAKAKDGFQRLTFHSCRHGFATSMLRQGVDPKTAADLGGWDSVTLFIDTYSHAMPKAQLTDSLFDSDTPMTQPNKTSRKNKGIDK
jgi:integrase